MITNEKKKFNWNKKFFGRLLAFMGLPLVIVFITYLPETNKAMLDILSGLDSPVQFITIMSFAVGFPLVILGASLSQSKRDVETENTILAELRSEETRLASHLKQQETDFGTLWAVTQQRIDYYHQIATSQARRSFISTQIAIAAGFILVVVMGIIAAQASSPTAAIAAGSVGVVGGGLSAYIGATFMKSQSQTTEQLSQFFLQPVEFSRLLGAERLLDNLEPEQKADAVKVIIASMMQPTSPPGSNKG